MTNLIQEFGPAPIAVSIAIGTIFLLIFIARLISTWKSRSSSLPSVTKVLGLPIIRNLLKLKEKNTAQDGKRCSEIERRWREEEDEGER